MEVDKSSDGLSLIGQLPDKIRNTANQIRDYDVQCYDILKNIKKSVGGLAKGYDKMTNEQKRQRIAEISKKYDEAEKLSKDKFKLASNLYDSVDEDITKMDKKKHESSSRKKWHSSDDDDEPTKGGRRKKKKSRKVEEPRSPRENLDMPVDPNEPCYCTCHQVSFGEMVCCDNTECKIEWFHFQCVGIPGGIPPSVKWFCETCRPSFKQVPNQWNYVTNEPPKQKLKKQK